MLVMRMWCDRCCVLGGLMVWFGCLVRGCCSVLMGSGFCCGGLVVDGW